MSRNQTTCNEFYDYIKEYIDEYEVRGDAGDYQPSETERFVALDIIMGLIDEDKFMNPIRQDAVKNIEATWKKWKDVDFELADYTEEMLFESSEAIKADLKNAGVIE